MKVLWFALTTILWLGNLQAEVRTVSVKVGKESLVFTQNKEGNWNHESKIGTLGVEKTSDGVELIKGGKAIAGGVLKNDKMAIYNEKGDVILGWKFSADKIKLIVPESKQTIEFKAKEDKFKIVIEEKELGKAAYYTDTEKTKVKNAKGETLAETRDLPKLSAALAPLACGPHLSQEKQIWAVLILLLMNR